MSDHADKSDDVSLWRCLHDGDIERINSDLSARTLTIVINVPFHWDFHKLPADTRFRIIGENVRIAEVFEFEPWPGATAQAQCTPWKEAQEQRQQDYEKGRLISADWNAFIAHIETDEDYEIMNAGLRVDKPFCVLNLGIMSYPNSNYREVKIHAERFLFKIGEREVSLLEFQDFGSDYWDDFAQKPKAQSAQSEHA